MCCTFSILIYELNFLFCQRSEIFCYLPLLVSLMVGCLVYYVCWKDNSVLCGEKIYNNIKNMFFNLSNEQTTKKHLLFLHIHIWLIHYLGKIQANFRLSAVCDLWGGKFFLRGFWTDRIGHVFVRVCFFVHVYSIHPSRISLMINVKSVVLLLDTKIYEAEEENHHSSYYPFCCFLL